HGITGPMTIAAFHAVKAAGLLAGDAAPALADLERVLRTPLVVNGHARPVRYRFAAQRAKRIAAALDYWADEPLPVDLCARDQRDWLQRLPGVGPKTASWIVRNLTASDEVAIIDIHVQRAGLVAGIFDETWQLPARYRWFEDAFCSWAAV